MAPIQAPIQTVIDDFDALFYGIATDFEHSPSARAKIQYSRAYYAIKRTKDENKNWRRLLEEEEVRCVRAMPFPYAITFLTHDDYERWTEHIAPTPSSQTTVAGVANNYGEAFDLIGHNGQYPDSVDVCYSFEEGHLHRVVVEWRR